MVFNKDQLPFISVIIPVFNEEKHLGVCLEAILKQDYPSDSYEIIVADGMSDDKSRKIISDIQKTHSNLHLIDNPGRIVPKGLNAAIEKAEGEIVVRVDAHTIIEDDYLKECVEALERSKADNVGGLMRPVGNNFVEKAIALATSTPFGLGNSHFHYSTNERFVDTVYMGAFRKEALYRAGLFDETLIRNQDYELNYRIRATGGKIFLTPRIKSYYFVRDNLKKLCSQYFQYGYWKARVMRAHPRSIKLRHLPAPVLVISLVISILLPVFWKETWFVPVSIIFAYMIFLIIGTISVSKKQNFWLVSLVPIIFVTLHLSWGFGVIASLTKLMLEHYRNLFYKTIVKGAKS